MTGQGFRRRTRRPGVFSPWDLAGAEKLKENRRLAGVRGSRKRSGNYPEVGGCGWDGHCQCSAQLLSRVSSRWGA
jgi:hypothetical protein